MRKLTISTSINLGACREFNHLRISNIEDFLSSYTNNVDYYSSPFKILKELESIILFQDEPEEVMLVNYKPEGYIIFNLEGIKEDGELRIVTYKYTGSAS